MDRRLDERFEAHLDVRIIELATGDCAEGVLTDISKSGVCVITSHQFVANAIVRMEVADSALYGCVAYCNGDEPWFRMGIELIQVLLGGTDMANLLSALLLEVLPETPGLVGSSS